MANLYKKATASTHKTVNDLMKLNHAEVFTAVHRTVASAFAQASAYRVYVPSFGTSWGFVVGGPADTPDVAAMPPDETDRRITERLVSPLRFYDGITHVGLFALPKYLRAAMAAEQGLGPAMRPQRAERRPAHRGRGAVTGAGEGVLEGADDQSAHQA